MIWWHNIASETEIIIYVVLIFSRIGFELFDIGLLWLSLSFFLALWLGLAWPATKPLFVYASSVSRDGRDRLYVGPKQSRIWNRWPWYAYTL